MKYEWEPTVNFRRFITLGWNKYETVESQSLRDNAKSCLITMHRTKRIMLPWILSRESIYEREEKIRVLCKRFTGDSRCNPDRFMAWTAFLLSLIRHWNAPISVTMSLVKQAFRCPHKYPLELNKGLPKKNELIGPPTNLLMIPSCFFFNTTLPISIQYWLSPVEPSNLKFDGHHWSTCRQEWLFLSRHAYCAREITSGCPASTKCHSFTVMLNHIWKLSIS